MNRNIPRACRHGCEGLGIQVRRPDEWIRAISLPPEASTGLAVIQFRTPVRIKERCSSIALARDQGSPGLISLDPALCHPPGCLPTPDFIHRPWTEGYS